MAVLMQVLLRENRAIPRIAVTIKLLSSSGSDMLINHFRKEASFLHIGCARRKTLLMVQGPLRKVLSGKQHPNLQDLGK